MSVLLAQNRGRHTLRHHGADGELALAMQVIARAAPSQRGVAQFVTLRAWLRPRVGACGIMAPR
ncbi:MAG: hypothetical protein KGL78_13045, partial [Burkholderiales bacterium]|nr:hypothetical protein [Burkholderiales bacterium]